MATAQAPLHGDDLLEAVTASLADLHERYYGRRPASARSQLMADDVLACVMGGIYTEVEQTLIELQRRTIVQENRSAFQNAMQDRFIDEVQRLTGRNVLAFVSDQHVGPDVEVELFVLAPQDIRQG